MNAQQELVVGYALGDLDEAQSAAFEAACRQCPALAAEARDLREALAIVGALAPEVEAPSPALRARLLAAAQGAGALSHWSAALARFFEISIDKARAMLDAANEPDTWDLETLPGVGLMHLSPGPRWAAADAGLVRFPASLHWPLHLHVGEERMLILSGGFRDDAGRAWGPGEELVMAPGSVHAFVIDATAPCICAVTLFDGLEMPPGHRVTH